ncbi:MAG: hypothetical protein ACC657_18805 [Thiohalomonadales bacterium]
MIRLVCQVIIITIFLISSTGCALQVPKIEQPDSSAIGISLEIEAPFGLDWLTRKSAEVVYFIRVDNNQSILQPSIIRSNYAKDGRVYLLNVLPGKYMAVAYFYEVPTGSSNGPKSTRYLVFFSRELVKKTYVSISKGQVAFAGNYILSTSLIGPRLIGVDYVQRHYKNMMSPNLPSVFNPVERTNRLFDDLSNNDENRVYASYEYRGLILKSERNYDAKNKFMKKASEDLYKGGWSTLIK